MQENNSTNQGKGSARSGSICRTGKKSARFCGTIMIVIGVIWLLQKTGFISLAWMHGIPFWPIALILFGAWIVAAGIVRKRRRNGETCC